MSSRYCHNCKSTTVFEDFNGSEVCTECGRTHEGGGLQLVDEQRYFVSNDQAITINKPQLLGKNEDASNRLTQSKKMAIKFAETLASNFKFTTEMNNELTHLYRWSLNHNEFCNSYLKTKQVLAGVCTYIVMLNYNQTVPMKILCTAVDASLSQFVQVYNSFLNANPDMKPTGAKLIEEMVPFVINEYKFLGSDKDNPNELIARIRDVLKLAKVCWLIDGRSPVELIQAATYIAWISLKPDERCKIPFKKFCQRLGLPFDQPLVKKRIRELTDLMTSLGNRLPWMKLSQAIKVNRRNLAWHIGEILRFKLCLIEDLKKECMNQKQNDTAFSTFNSCEGMDSSSELSPLFSHASEDSADSSDQNNNSRAFKNVRNDASELEWMQKFKIKTAKQKRKKDDPVLATTGNVNNEEILDEEISDTEIDSYIRTPEQVRTFKKIKKVANRVSSKQLAKLFE